MISLNGVDYIIPDHLRAESKKFRDLDDRILFSNQSIDKKFIDTIINFELPKIKKHELLKELIQDYDEINIYYLIDILRSWGLNKHVDHLCDILIERFSSSIKKSWGFYN